MLRDMLEELGLESFPKTSGSKGFQVYVPLNTPRVTYEQTKPFANALAQLLEQQHPKLVVSKQKKELQRQGPGRLEPEQRLQDHGLRLLAAREGAADRLDAGRMGRGGVSAEEEGGRSARLRPRGGAEAGRQERRPVRARADAQAATAEAVA